MSEVVDTDVVSFLLKNHPIGQRYDPELIGRIPLISFMTVAELERWALQYRWSSRRTEDLRRKWAEVMVSAQAGLRW